MPVTTTYEVHVRTSAGAVSSLNATGEADAWNIANSHEALGSTVTVTKTDTTTADVVAPAPAPGGGGGKK